MSWVWRVCVRLFGAGQNWKSIWPFHSSASFCTHRRPIDGEAQPMADPTLVADSSTVGDDVEYTPPVVQGLTMNALLNPQAEPWSINAGASIAAMSPNPSMSQVVVAGREVLKIFSTESLAEVHNIRFGRVNMLYSSNDVRWNPNESHSHYIATAATNGAVVIWNLNMKGKKLGTSRRNGSAFAVLYITILLINRSLPLLFVNSAEECQTDPTSI
mgnify:CR=1 FL=1